MNVVDRIRNWVRPKPKAVRYILRPGDGIKIGIPPTTDPAQGEVAYKTTTDAEGKLLIAVCSFCGGNCGQCSTSIGSGIPFDFDLMAKNGKWTSPGWRGFGFGR